MLCQNVNRTLQVVAFCFLASPAFAATPIERTVIAYYDLANHKSEHHEIAVATHDNQVTFTFTPLSAPSASPAIFTIRGCVISETPTVKRGLLTVTTTKTDANDTRLASVGDFVNDHNLRGIWIHLTSQQHLFFSPDTEGMMVMDTLPSMSHCR